MMEASESTNWRAVLQASGLERYLAAFFFRLTRLNV
jgi:hypothetical protein